MLRVNQLVGFGARRSSVAASAFPVVEGTSGAVQTTGTTSHAITMPGGVTIGERIVVGFCVDGAATISVDSGTGWSIPYNVTDSNSNVSGAVFTKIADGSDTLTVATVASQLSTHVSYRISNAASLTLTGSSASLIGVGNPDPPVHHPHLGKQKILWLPFIFNEDGDPTIAQPTNYTDFTTQDGSATNSATQCSQRNLEAHYEDPGPYDHAAANAYLAVTVAIAPSDTPVGSVMPYIASVGALVAGTGTTTATLPSGWAENDILCIAVESAAQAISAPSGYSEVTNSPQAIGSAADVAATAIQLFWKRATSSESNVGLADAGDHTISVMFAVRGCPTGSSPFDVTAGATAATSTSVSFPSVTTTVDACLVVHLISNPLLSARLSAWANASLLPVIEVFDAGNGSGNDGSIGIAYGGKETAGSVGNTTATLSTTAEQAMLTVAFKPA